MKELISIDIDNTLINYNFAFKYHFNCFFSMPVPNCPDVKSFCKSYIFANYPESVAQNHWINLQGEVYGNSYNLLELFPNALKNILDLKNKFNIIFVSHKSEISYCGRFSNLRQNIKKFLTAFFPDTESYFFDTKEKKINAINTFCSLIHIDDLHSVLDDLNSSIFKIHFSHNNFSKHLKLSTWKQINYIISNFNLREITLFSSSNCVFKNNDNIHKLFKYYSRYSNELFYSQFLHDRFHSFSSVPILDNRDKIKAITYKYIEKQVINSNWAVDFFSSALPELKKMNHLDLPSSSDSRHSISKYFEVLKNRLATLGIKIDFSLPSNFSYLLPQSLSFPDINPTNIIFSEKVYLLDLESSGLDHPIRTFFNLKYNPNSNLSSLQLEQVSNLFSDFNFHLDPSVHQLIDILVKIDWKLIVLQKDFSSHTFTLLSYNETIRYIKSELDELAKEYNFKIIYN